MVAIQEVGMGDNQKRPSAKNDGPVRASSDAEDLQKVDSQNISSEFSRRDFVKAAGVLGGAVALGVPLRLAADESSTSAFTSTVKLTINGTPRTLSLDTRVTLLDALRENLGLTGTKKGCDHGQ